MIKLKDLLLEGKPPSIFIPRRIEDRVERMIRLYIRNGNKGNLNLQNLHLTKLPEILKDITVDGDFYCGNNNLTSLENAPKSVDGSFYCDNNLLTSLKGAPKTVGGGFYCGSNKLTSLVGAPKIISEDFNCNDNHLTSLEFAPKSVGYSFQCGENLLTSLQGAPESVGKNFYFYKNTGKFTEKDIRAVCDVKGRVYV